jgi:hypothetical protein
VQTENLSFEVRKESNTNLQEVEQLCYAKSDQLRKALAEVCQRLNMTSPMSVI